MSTPHLRQAEIHLSTAEKAMKTTLFRWSPDWDTAGTEYDRAASCYKAGKAMKSAVECYQKAADAKYKTRQPFVAGKLLESAALAAKTYDVAMCAKMYEQAAQMFAECGNSEKVAACFSAAANAVSATDVDQAVKYFQSALDTFEIDDRETMGGDTYRALIGIVLRQKRYDLAIDCFKKMGEANAKHKRLHETYKCDLSIVILMLQTDDYVGADRYYQDKLSNREDFVRSDEAAAAGRLLDAYEDGDPQKLAKVITMTQFEFLHPNMLKLVRELMLPGQTERVAVAPKRAINYNRGKDALAALDKAGSKPNPYLDGTKQPDAFPSASGGGGASSAAATSGAPAKNEAPKSAGSAFDNIAIPDFEMPSPVHDDDADDRTSLLSSPAAGSAAAAAAAAAEDSSPLASNAPSSSLSSSSSAALPPADAVIEPEEDDQQGSLC